MRLQAPKLYGKAAVRQFELFEHRVMDLSGQHFLPKRLDLTSTLAFAKRHKSAVVIAALSLLLVWQWHVAGLATLRAETAERDMELNAQQAIQLSDAVLKAQASHDRLEKKMSGFGLPPAH